MLIDIFSAFEAMALNVRDQIGLAYPDNKLNVSSANKSMTYIEGSINTIKLCLINRIEKEKKESITVRELDEDWEPSMDAVSEIIEVKVKQMPIDYIGFFNEYIRLVEGSISYYKKINNDTVVSVHGQIQHISGYNEMLLAFLKSVKTKLDV